MYLLNILRLGDDVSFFDRIIINFLFNCFNWNILLLNEIIQYITDFFFLDDLRLIFNSFLNSYVVCDHFIFRNHINNFFCFHFFHFIDIRNILNVLSILKAVKRLIILKILSLLLLRNSLFYKLLLLLILLIDWFRRRILSWKLLVANGNWKALIRILAVYQFILVIWLLILVIVMRSMDVRRGLLTY